MSDKGLSDQELMAMARSQKLKALHGCFMGVFSKDQLPVLRDNTCAIVNLETSDLPGSHWVSCGVKNKQGWYFDSFGLDVPPLIIQKLPPKPVRVSRVIQADDSTLCGLYALGACEAVQRSDQSPSHSLLWYEKLFQRPILDEHDQDLYRYFDSL
jgi:hypothetical protein